MSYLFSRKDRICRRFAFKRVYHSGFFLKASYAYFYFLLSHRDFSRLGIVASKRIGNSVVCSRIKRCYREIFRKSLSRKRNPHVDLVVRVRKIASSAGYFDLEEDFEKAMEKIKRD